MQGLDRLSGVLPSSVGAVGRADLDQWVEHLAFGRSIPKLDSCLGLYVGMDSVILSEVRMAAGKPVVGQTVQAAFPRAQPAAGKDARTGGALNTEALADPARLADLIRPAMSKVQWKARHVVVSLSAHFGLHRYFLMPALDRRYWQTAMPAEAKKHIPLPFGELAHDFDVRTLSVGGKAARLGILFQVTHRKNLEGIRAMAGKLGWILSGVEVAPCSVARLWNFQACAPPEAAYARVHFDSRGAQILVSEHGWPILFREVHLESEAGLTASRKVDLAGCLDFCRRQLGGVPQLSRIFLSGSNPDPAGWKQAFSQETGLTVETQEEPKVAGLKSAEWGALASAGAALQHLGPTALSLDLSGTGRTSPADKRAASAIFLFSGLGAALLLAWALGLYGAASMKSREFRKLRARNAGVGAVFEGKTADQIEQTIRQLEEKVRGFEALSGPKIQLTHVLEDLAGIVPDSLWLNDLSWQSSVGAEGAGGGGTLGLGGRVAAGDVAAEQDIGIQFRAKLQNDPRFGKLFECGGISVQANPGAGGFAPGAASQSEDRTSFKIECKARR